MRDQEGQPQKEIKRVEKRVAEEPGRLAQEQARMKDTSAREQAIAEDLKERETERAEKRAAEQTLRSANDQARRKETLARDQARRKDSPAGERTIEEAKRELGTQDNSPLKGDMNGDVFDMLKGWRRINSEKESVPAYCVLNDRTLKELAIKMPENLSELKSVNGIGPSKIEKYGEDILKIVKYGC